MCLLLVIAREKEKMRDKIIILPLKPYLGVFKDIIIILPLDLIPIYMRVLGYKITMLLVYLICNYKLGI